MTRKLLGLIVAGAMLVALVPETEARPRPAGKRGKKFRANKTFGLGLMLGVPAGLSGKYFLSPDTALDFGVGVYNRAHRNDGVHLHIDFLWHPVVLATNDAFWLPLYIGIGGRIWDHDRNNDFAEDTHIGVRVPLGISFDLQRTPLDIFLELAYVADLIIDDGHGFSDINFAVGVRYYFN